MSVLVLDAGNSVIKAKIARREHSEVSFPHALKQLTESEYNNILSRSKTSGMSTDYMRINRQAYVIGESAERHGVHTQRTGSARYTRDYYGIFAAAVLGRLYDRGREISIFGSHPPGDVKFRQDLMEAVIGDWDVETKGRESHFRVTYANTFDEPVGGLMNILLTEDGQHYRHSDIQDGHILVIDIGGFTTDYLGVNPGGEIDYSLARSVPIGIKNEVSDIEDSFRANNLEAVKDTTILPPERIRKAIATGIFDGGGRRFHCEDEAIESTNILLNRIADTYQQIAGGSLSWDTIILTGGGSALLY